MRKGSHHTEESKAKMSRAHLGRKLSEEHKRHISEAHKGRTHSDKWNRAVGLANRGKKRTEEQNERNRQALLKYYETHKVWNKGKKAKPEWIEKQRQSLLKYYETHDAPQKGRHLSDEHKVKLGEAKRRYLQTHPHPFQGKQHTEDTKRKISSSRVGKYVGPDHYNWRGGISFEPYNLDFNDVLKKQIRERDGYTCQLCRGIWQGSEKRFAVHHIDYDKGNNQPINLITLCIRCNSRVNFNRDSWAFYFMGLQVTDSDRMGVWV